MNSIKQTKLRFCLKIWGTTTLSMSLPYLVVGDYLEVAQENDYMGMQKQLYLSYLLISIEYYCGWKNNMAHCIHAWVEN